MTSPPVENADIFISFASQDGKVAKTICHAIENRGFKCWISNRDILPGENFQSAIVRAIRHAKVLLLVFTSNSNRSEEMTKELALASQQKLMVVPLRVENVNPSDAFAYEFATRQWIDLFSDWEQAMNHLCARLSAALVDDRTHTDTIVLGRPSLQDRTAMQFMLARRKRSLYVGAAAVVLATIAGITVAKLLSKPEEPAVQQAAVVTAPASEAGAPVDPLAVSMANLAAQREAAANGTPMPAPITVGTSAALAPAPEAAAVPTPEAVIAAATMAPAPEAAVAPAPVAAPVKVAETKPKPVQKKPVQQKKPANNLPY